MTGLSVLFNSSGGKLDTSLIARFSGDSDRANYNREQSRLSPSLWVQNVYRPVTTAQGGLISPASGRVKLLFHGEVYNCPELAKYLGVERPTIKSIDDGPELVSIGLEREGLEFASKINGSFVLLAYYPKEKTLYLANDRFGLRPHYYGWCGETLLVSPQVATIHESWNREARIDRAATVEFFAFEQLLGNKTLVEDISVFPPASICRVEGGTIRTEQYWDFPYPDKPFAASEEELCEELQRNLLVAINRQLPAQCPLGVPLSGGLDSRLLASVASQKISKLPVFTYGDPACMERRFASEVAQRIGATHFTVSPENTDWEKHLYTSARLCDGMLPSLHAHILLLRSILTERAGVVLDGLAGDMIFGGYVKRHMACSLSASDTAKWLLKDKYSNRISSAEMEDLFLDRSFLDCLPLFVETMRKRVQMCQSSQLANVNDYVAYRERVRRFTINGNTLLRDFVEVRTPYFDYDLIDFALGLPVRLRLDKRLYKGAIRNLFPELRNLGHTPIGENLRYPHSVTNILRVLRRPDTVLRGYVPKSIKTFLRQSLKSALPRGDWSVSYDMIFGRQLAALIPAYDDTHRGWKQLTSYGVIEEILSEASRDRTMISAVKLSLWLTFQMYREVSGVEI